MIIIRLQGGLGNQMFQYAAAAALANQHKCKLLADISCLTQTSCIKEGFTPRLYELGIFKNLNAFIASESITQSFLKVPKKNKLLQKLGLLHEKKYEETTFTYNDDFFLLRPNVLVEGYFQSEKYFSRIGEIIRQNFLFPDLQPDDLNITLLKQINSTSAVSVHVRRGDYLKDPLTNAFHGTCNIEYYRKAFEYMKQQCSDVIFVFFSDDQSWVKETFMQQLSGSILVENNSESDNWKDMYLMSKCNHHIIANSSFSWWGAWLNNKADKIVIAPENWFADKEKNEQTHDNIPPSWIRL